MPPDGCSFLHRQGQPRAPAVSRQSSAAVLHAQPLLLLQEAEAVSPRAEGSSPTMSPAEVQQGPVPICSLALQNDESERRFSFPMSDAVPVDEELYWPESHKTWVFKLFSHGFSQPSSPPSHHNSL